ncbi:MAG: winged helix-turn-helix domain-containing protein, partial [Mucinivorans sp.]
LTKTEYSILKLLVANPSRIFPREELIAKVWGSQVYVEPRTVDVHIARLRKKLGTQGSLIVNRSGYGYTLGNS